MENIMMKEFLDKAIRKKLFTFHKGKFLFHEDKNAEGVFFIIFGRVKITKKVNVDQNTILYIANGGDMLGLHAVINKHSHTNSAIALSKTNVYLIPKKEFLKIVKENIHLKLAVMKILCSGIDILENKIMNRNEKSATERLAETLIYLTKTFGTDKDNFIDLKLPTKDLADMIGVSKEYLSQKICEFKKTGLISSSSGRIRILDIVHLEEIAGINTLHNYH